MLKPLVLRAENGAQKSGSPLLYVAPPSRRTVDCSRDWIGATYFAAQSPTPTVSKKLKPSGERIRNCALPTRFCAPTSMSLLSPARLRASKPHGFEQVLAQTLEKQRAERASIEANARKQDLEHQAQLDEVRPTRSAWHMPVGLHRVMMR